MAESPLICMVSLGERTVFSRVTCATSFFEFKFDVAERLKVPYDTLSMVYKSERIPDLSFEIENEDDMECMVEHNRNIGCLEIHIRATIDVDVSRCENTPKQPPEIIMNTLKPKFIDSTSAANHGSERIPIDNPSGSSVVRSDDIINNTVMIPGWWHNALTEEGQEFESAEELRLALTYYSLAKMFDYEFKKNEPKRIRVYCRYKETYECPWMLFASPVKNANRLSIKKFVNEHTCGQYGQNTGRSRASRKFIATQLQPLLKVRPEIRPVDVQKEFLTNYGLRIDYSKIWWGKERAQEKLYGDIYESYDQLRWYERMVKETNLGNYIHVDQNEGRFSRLFVCYAACIKGFLSGCRPLLFLDGTFLKDRYKVILLSAIAYDGNQGIFPLAYCICDQENLMNWKWFLQGLWSILYERADPYNPPHQLVIISDADKGIKESVKEYFPEALHSRCVLHLVENFRLKLKDLGMKSKDTHVLGNLLQSACYKYTIAEWNEYMKEIYDMDPRAYNIAMNYSPDQWANAFFPGIRYGHVTSNVAESFNNWIREARMLRILQMVKHIRKQIMVRMSNRRLLGDKWAGYLCPQAEMVLKENIEKGRPLDVKQATADIFEVQAHKTTRVDLEKKTCTCRAWDVMRIPCKHACAVISYMKRDIYQYCDWFMSIEAFKKSYDPILYPIPDYEKRSVPRDEIELLSPHTIKRKGEK
ncbi:uncharacterized protein LOC109838960 [Asparagus officinalis]|uniref:uncharacterized protein LOC109838960 n=1 Tax=Asparagus officinalis TaxID=4686 RepID=UPI00098E85B5|nr:uncharacterized protein LOC109838960 [Asparagus officinalis]